jgi:chromosome partitioning protein
MHIVAVTNVKGGVGKTTTAVNLAYLAASAGRPTLLWDLDPQGAATWTLRGTPNAHASAKKLLRGKRQLPELVAPTAYDGLDLLPADFSYRKFDVHLGKCKRPAERLLEMSAALRERYDFLYLDCPPGISLLSENVLHAADALVVPLLPAPLSLRMLELLQEFIARQGWMDLALLPFFSMVDRRKALHAEIIATTRARCAVLLRTEIPYWSEIERMSVRRAPLPAYARHSAAAQLYAALLNEVHSRLGEPPMRVQSTADAGETARATAGTDAHPLAAVPPANAPDYLDTRSEPAEAAQSHSGIALRPGLGP